MIVCLLTLLTLLTRIVVTPRYLLFLFGHIVIFHVIIACFLYFQKRYPNICSHHVVNRRAQGKNHSAVSSNRSLLTRTMGYIFRSLCWRKVRSNTAEKEKISNLAIRVT